MSSRSQHLQPAERLTLASLLQQGWSLRRIAQWLGRSPSTLSREVERNRCCEGYWSAPAQTRCQQRRIDSRSLPKLHADGALWHIVTDFLLRHWSS